MKSTVQSSFTGIVDGSFRITNGRFLTRNCFLHLQASLTQLVNESRIFTCSRYNACTQIICWPHFRHSKFGFAAWTPRL